MKRSASLAVLGTLLAIAPAAHAFCGFYVGGAGADLYADATQVVLMRDGVRTVLSMQNDYKGPPQGFAMVVPVPVVLSKETVKVLPREVFEKVDQLDAPRLVEYWEQDPCNPHQWDLPMASPPSPVEDREESGGSRKRDYGVKVEAKFSVGEYDVVILSAKESTGLDAWLRAEKYAIPAGAEPYLRPYVERGSKFFVAKVDPKRVTFAGGRARLSPLRFHYDSEQFALPVRLGLASSSGTQDLVVHVLGTDQRYEVANYPNVAIPTNLEVTEQTKGQFGAFYAALFDRVMQKNPKAIVTEYAWQAGSCDPCPTPPLDVDALAALGADVLPSVGGKADPSQLAQRFVLTRLHARYSKDTLGADLVFRAASPIVGGREHVVGDRGQLERGAMPDQYNNFQARYVIRHPWTGPVACANPQRGVWGGPPGEQYLPGGKTEAVKDTAYAPRGTLQLSAFVKDDAPEYDVGATPPVQGDPPLGVVVPPPAHTCGCSVARPGWTAGLGALVPLAALALRRRRRR